jgi:hypothetical protein
VRLGDADALDGRLEFERRRDNFGVIVPYLNLVDNVSVVDDLPLGVLGWTDLVLGELGLLPSSNEGNVAGRAEHFRAADAAADFCGGVRYQQIRIPGASIPLATLGSHVLEEKMRNPDSRAAEKQEQSAFRDTESTKGPLSESRIGRVFILDIAETWFQ